MAVGAVLITTVNGADAVTAAVCVRLLLPRLGSSCAKSNPKLDVTTPRVVGLTMRVRLMSRLACADRLPNPHTTALSLPTHPCVPVTKYKPPVIVFVSCNCVALPSVFKLMMRHV